MMKRMRGGEMSGGDLGSQQISAGLVPRGEPRYYTTYLTCKDTEDEGDHGQIALFEEMRTTNILPRTSAYQVAVERASVDTKALPSYIAQVDTTSTNPNQLSSLVGCELFWAGSLFPSTRNGAYIGEEVDDSFITCGGSSLPIKYSMSSGGGPQVSVDSTIQYYNPAVSGVLEAWIENNPNSSYWTGQYSFNIKAGFFLDSFQRAIDRAFAPWTYILDPTHGLDLELYFRPSVYGDTWICDSLHFQALSVAPDQLLLSDLQAFVPPGQPIDPELLAALQASFNGFYPIQSDIPSTTLKHVGTTVAQKKLLALAAANLVGSQTLAFTCKCFVYNKGAATTIGTGSPTVSFLTPQTEVPGTTLPVANQAYRNADNYLTLAFYNGRDSAANYTQAVPCFDFYPTMTYSTVAQTDQGTITLAPRSMKSPFVDDKPSRDDYLASAWVLGFIPDTIFTMAQVNYSGVTTGLYYANRPIAPAFVSRLSLGSYQNLKWKPMDEFISSRNPKPGSPYYYGYGTTSYLTDVVNPAISSCFENVYDDEFETGELPSVVMARLLTQTPINAITDLSLSAQLYCMAYFNSSSAPKEAIQAISDWNSGQTYVAGSPVTFVNKDPSSPIRNLYIANTTTNSTEPQEPIPFKNTEYWLYCGPFLYSSAIPGATYIAGELLTYNGSVLVYLPSYTGVTPPTFQFDLNEIPLDPRMILLGGDQPNNFNKLKPTPVIGTAPPVMTLNTSPGLEGDVFELKCDTYGFGTYDSGKPTDYLRAYARDSWGCLQSDARSFNTNRIYDEFVVFESNTAFRDQFRGFPTLCKQYTDPITAIQSAYWLYNFVVDPSSSILPPMPAEWNNATIQANQADGYCGGSKRFLASRIVGTNETPVSSVQALRNSDSTVYFWTFTSSETSRYAGWNPVQSIVIEGQTIPVDAAHLPVSQPIVTGLTQPAYGEARMIIAEILVAGVPAEGTVLYEPNNPRHIFLSQSTDLKYFSYKLSWRNKFTGELVPLILSQNGAALIVFMFTAKD
jgi:hypothetical protein